MRPPASTYTFNGYIAGSRFLAAASMSRARCVMKSGVSASSKPSIPRRALSAGAKSSAPRTGTASSCTPNVRAAASAPWSCIALVGCGGCDSIATLLSLGTSSLSSCTCFPAISEALMATPVMLPPGCPRFGTRPISTGAYTATKTIGIDVVALLAAIAHDEFRARMTSTFNRTNSSANCGSWSRLPSVDRNSQTRFRPSTYPRSRRPC